jgi:hypothetical protein
LNQFLEEATSSLFILAFVAIVAQPAQMGICTANLVHGVTKGIEEGRLLNTGRGKGNKVEQD